MARGSPRSPAGAAPPTADRWSRQRCCCRSTRTRGRSSAATLLRSAAVSSTPARCGSGCNHHHQTIPVRLPRPSSAQVQCPRKSQPLPRNTPSLQPLAQTDRDPGSSPLDRAPMATAVGAATISNLSETFLEDQAAVAIDCVLTSGGSIPASESSIIEPFCWARRP